MTYEQKIEKARSVIDEHNSRLVEGEHKVNADNFFTELRKAGGTTESGLRSCKFEDLQACGLPLVLARVITTDVFRSTDDEKKGKNYVSSKAAERMSHRELLDHYDSREADNAVGKRLAEVSKNQRFIIFNADGSVNTEASVKLLDELRDSYPERETYVVANLPCKTYRVGQRPAELADENPLYPGRRLRPDGTCDQTNRSWDGVSYEVRVLLRLALESGELKINSLDDAHASMDRAVAPDADKNIRLRYQKAAVRFEELKGVGKLPTLKVEKGANATGRLQDPFFGAGSVHTRS